MQALVHQAQYTDLESFWKTSPEPASSKLTPPIKKILQPHAEDTE